MRSKLPAARSGSDLFLPDIPRALLPGMIPTPEDMMRIIVVVNMVVLQEGIILLRAILHRAAIMMVAIPEMGTRRKRRAARAVCSWALLVVWLLGLSEVPSLRTLCVSVCLFSWKITLFTLDG